MCNQSSPSPAAASSNGSSSSSNQSHHQTSAMKKQSTRITVSSSSDISTSSASTRNERSRETNGDSYEQRNTHSKIRFFLFGFSVAILFMAVAAVTTTYVVCKRVLNDDITKLYRMCLQSKEAVAQKKRKRKRGLLAIFRRRRHAEEQEIDCSTLDLKGCGCQWMQDSLLDVFSTFPFPHSTDTTINIPLAATCDPMDDAVLLTRPKEDFPTAFTPEIIPLSNRQLQLIDELGQQVRAAVPDWEERASAIPWGGPGKSPGASMSPWWAPALTANRKTASRLEQLDGGNLLYSYLRIMNWPQSLDVVHFPFKMCKKHGCPASFALNHTLTFREIYQPWLVSPSMKSVNAKGLVYQHGFSPSMDDDKHAPHAIVWLRPGLVVHVDEQFYARTLIRELERAVSLSMEQSNGRVGKFNVVVSGKDFFFGAMPSLRGVKMFVTILQDHYVDRLGVVLLTDMGVICELLLKLFLPIITEEVRNKIIVLPHDQQEGQAMLETILGKENVPIWLGGSNVYHFDVQEYYSTNDAVLASDDHAMEYISSLPYHA